VRLPHKHFWLGVGSAYLLYAGIAGMAMKVVLPALNPLGVAYAGMTWPVAMTCVAMRAECTAVPPQRYSKWLFTFDEESQATQSRDILGDETRG
jgi:hypothetical protein